MSVTYKLTYFDIKGLAEPIRLLFACAGVPYEDIRIPYNPPALGQPAPIDPEIRQKLPFGQVPLLEVGDVSISQANAIGRFLARKFNLFGDNPIESAKIDELIDAARDYFESCRGGLRGIKTEEEKAAGLKNIIQVATPKYLGKFNQILEANGGEFFVGKSVSWADLLIFHMMTQWGEFVGVDLIKDYPALQKLAKNIENIPNIKKWLNERPKTRV